MFLLAEAAQTQAPTTLSYIIMVAMGIAVALLLYCVFTIYKNPYFTEAQKLGWLLLTLALPIFGPVAWLIRAHLEKKHQLSQQDAAAQPESHV